MIEEELARITHHRPLRDINEWGVVDIDGLTLSIRSRLSGELSYALTTFTLVSTMRGQTHGSGFPIAQCPDLLDEVLDLVEDEAFGQEDSTSSNADLDARISTHREMIVTAQDKGNQLFFTDHVSPTAHTGPRQRPGSVILVVLNIVRNLAATPDNIGYLARHERLLDLLLRLCDITKGEDGQLRPASAVLSLQDLIALRKNVLFTVASLAPAIQFTDDPTEFAVRMSRRVFELVSSFIIDPVEALSPSGCAVVSGSAINNQLVPPIFPDVALELFTRLSQPDNNRRILSQTIPQPWIWELFEALVHRLPVVDADFHLAARETWLSYLEKVIMAMYSLCFLAPPSLKSRIKDDTSLGFTKTVIRMIYKFLTNPNPDVRSCLVVCSRRAIETMRVVDDSEDAFDTPKVAAPAILFGMGHREVGEEGIEKGTGLLGGHRQLTWDLLMLREIISDPVMFSELESMARVDKID
jgi:SWI/SNF chromatin-remodeling complex subunit SWI1